MAVKVMHREARTTRKVLSLGHLFFPSHWAKLFVFTSKGRKVGVVKTIHAGKLICLVK